MELWQKKESHYNVVDEASQDTVLVSPTGFVIKFNGKEFFAKLEKLGHSTINFEKCKCGGKNEKD